MSALRLTCCLLASLLAPAIVATAGFQNPVLPKGIKPANMKEVREALEPLGWNVMRPEVAEPAGLVEHENVVYISRPERDLKLDLFLPGNVQNPPILMLIHGGGWKQGSKESYRNHALRFVENGYAAVAIQYRLSGEAKYPAALEDCHAAVAWLKEHSRKFGYDWNRFAVYGGSAGAHLAALVAVLSPEVKAAIPVAGPTDLMSELVREQSPDPESNYFKFFGKSIQEMPQVYMQASPFVHVNEQTPPMLVIAEWSLDSSEKMLQQFRHSHVYHETFILSGGVHGHWNWEPWFTPALEKCDSFLRNVWD